MRKLQQIKGITLIALIVTIIVLLILAGITISLTIGQDGIINIAQQAGENYIDAQAQEKKELENLYSSMLIATNDDSKITISMEDLNSLIDSKVQEKISELLISNSMCSPRVLTTTSLPVLNGRVAGTYKASSSSYTKTNSTEMSKYLAFKEGVGWTVLKDGWYYLDTYSSHELDGSVGGGTVYSYYLINGKSFTFTVGSINSYVPDNYTAMKNGNATIYLKAGDIIDYSFVPTITGNYSNARFSIWAMFE